MEKMIKELKKGDRFRFNNELLTVIKKFRNDDSPLKATSSKDSFTGEPELFHHDELVVEYVEQEKDKVIYADLETHTALVMMAARKKRSIKQVLKELVEEKKAENAKND